MLPKELDGFARQVLLPAAGDAHLAIGHVLGDDRARPDQRAVAHTHRSHQGRIAADEGPFADGGLELVLAVIVAGDGARTDIGARADLGIPQIGQVIGFGALAQTGFFEPSSSTAPGRRRA